MCIHVFMKENTEGLGGPRVVICHVGGHTAAPRPWAPCSELGKTGAGGSMAGQQQARWLPQHRGCVACWESCPFCVKEALNVFSHPEFQYAFDVTF